MAHKPNELHRNFSIDEQIWRKCIDTRKRSVQSYTLRQSSVGEIESAAIRYSTDR